MLTVDIKEFALTGYFGPVEIGSTKREVVSHLGEPSDFADLGATGFILRYGWYEFYFQTPQALESIQNDNYLAGSRETFVFTSKQLDIVPWFVPGGAGGLFGQACNELAAEGTAFDRIDYFGRDVIRLTSGVILDFADEPPRGDHRELLGLRYWPGSDVHLMS